ncbi:hypothetical protein V8E53_002402 [Lactarius tabidus]
MFIIFPFQGAYIYPVLRPFYISFILVVFSHLPGTGSGAFLTSLPFESRSGVVWNVGSSPSGWCDGDRHLSLPQLMRSLV